MDFTNPWFWVGSVVGGIVALVVLLAVISATVHIVPQYQTAVLYRLGRFHGTRTGLFFVNPLLTTVQVVDVRVLNQTVAVKDCLSRDMVSLAVDAVLTWQVTDPEKAVAGTTNYASAVTLLGETTLREIVGSSHMEDLIGERDSLDTVILAKMEPTMATYGAHLVGVRIKDVQIPADLMNAMSQSAQASREATARVSLADSEKAIAQTIVDAAALYNGNETALELRRLNIAYEAVKSDNSKVIFVPTSIMDALGRATSAR
jgi:regulator of protease activity HflC (stomatin/prohibitin superfamily)